jgi:hypothetical protein
VQIAPSPALARQLRAAVADRRWIHHVECATYDEDGQGKDCDCGIPDLLGDLLMLIEPGVSRATRAA